MKPYLDLNSRLAYASEKELDWLAEYGRTHEGATVVMIGAGPGNMSLALLDSHTPISLYVIDNALSDTFRKHIEWAGAEMPTIFVGDSAEAGNKWDGSAVDLLIVDGDHSYEGVRRDLIAWWVHVKAGGLVFFHDYYRKGPEWDGVAVAVKEWFSERRGAYKNVKTFDSTRIVQRLK